MKLTLVLCLICLFQGCISQNDISDFIPDGVEEGVQDILSSVEETVSKSTGVYFEELNKKFDSAQEEVQQTLEAANVAEDVQQSVSNTLEKLQDDVNDMMEDRLDTFEGKLESSITFVGFYDLLQQTNLLTELDFEGKEHTVFIPSVQALEKFTAGKTLSEQELTDVLKYHIIPGEKLSADQLQDGQKLETALQGESLAVKVTTGTVEDDDDDDDNDDDDDDDDDDEDNNNNNNNNNDNVQFEINYDEFDDKVITIVGANNEANLYDESEEYKMGYLHLIDAVLEPPSA